jgi:hypothetical protein
LQGVSAFTNQRVSLEPHFSTTSVRLNQRKVDTMTWLLYLLDADPAYQMLWFSLGTDRKNTRREAD